MTNEKDVPERIYVAREWARQDQLLDGGIWRFEGAPDDIEYIRADGAAPVVDDQFRFWISNYWPDWEKAEQGTIELMRAAWDAATRLIKFNESALKGAIDYTVELEAKLARAEQPNQLTDLQKAVIEHDDDMARLDRNTLPATPIAATQGEAAGRQALASELLGHLDRITSTTAAYHFVRNICKIELGLEPDSLGAEIDH